MIPYWTVEGGFVIDKKMVCVDLFLKGLFQDLSERKDLVDGGLSRSEATLIRSNQLVDDGLQSFTQFARHDLICDIKKANPTVVGANGGIAFLVDWAEHTETPSGMHSSDHILLRSL